MKIFFYLGTIVSCLGQVDYSSLLIAMQPAMSAPAGYNPATDAKVIEWLKADAMVMADDANCSRWTNSAGYDAYTPDTPPKYKSNVQNSKPAIYFTGQALDVPQITQTQPLTVWVVFKRVSAGTHRWVFDSTNAASRCAFLADGGGTWIMYAGGADGTDGAADTSWHIAQCYFNGASSTLTLDGGSSISMSTGTAALDGLHLALNQANTLASDVYIGEVIVQNAAATDAAAIFSYLNERWAVY